MDLDEFDRRLLEALQHNSHEIGEELAKLTHLSPAACLRRAKRLRDEGIILADVSIVAPEAVGRPLMMIVLVTLEHEQIEIIESFKRSVRDSIAIRDLGATRSQVHFQGSWQLQSLAPQVGLEPTTLRLTAEHPLDRFRC
jgi:DNA-binding Lrp family transcriptional regulator